MTLLDIIEVTIMIIKAISKIARIIYNSEDIRAELRDVAKRASTILNHIEDTLYRWEKLAQRFSVDDEIHLMKDTERMKTVIITIQDVLKKIHDDRYFLQRIAMKSNEYKQQLSSSVDHLIEIYQLVDQNVSGMKHLEIHRRELLDFRKLSCNILDKQISKFQFSIVEQTSSRILAIGIEHFDPEKYACFMKVSREQLFIGYHLRTWSTETPIKIINEERPKYSRTDRQKKNVLVSTVTNIDRNDKKLDFSEISMSPDYICGLALTQSIVYIATKHHIKVVLLANKKILAEYSGGDGYKSFKQISFIYIPSNDTTSLYVIDCGQCAVHQYRIDDSGNCFEYIRRYVVISNVNQKCNLISCIIYKSNLFVSDNGNKCLHVFPLDGERQSCYLIDPEFGSFSPGSLCVYHEYFYIANCSTYDPRILVLDEFCRPKFYFQHRSLQKILAMDIDLYTKQLFILTTTMITNENNDENERPLILSIDLPLNSNH